MRIHTRSRTKSHDEELFQTRVPGVGGPSIFSLLGSICFHGAAVFGLTALSLRPYVPPAPPPAAFDPTVIRIGDKLFFVTKLEPADAPRQTQSPKPAPPQKLLTKATEVKAVAPPAPAAETAPKIFVPREVRRNLISESTLIQPLSPPDLVPPITPLPTFRVSTGFPRLTKTFVVPGRRSPSPPDPTPVPAPPNVEFASAVPAVNPLPSALQLPPAPPPLITDEPPQISTTRPFSAVGDPANILSLSDRPVAPSDRLIVPPGNLLGATGDGVILRTGTANGDARGKSGDQAGKSAGTTPGSTPSGGVSGRGPAASPRSESSAGISGGASSGSLDGGPIPKGGVQHRPSNGTFDAVVVQSSDQSPESKDLLTGRPIYTVYVTLGTAKDWALHFCVPGETEPAVKGDVVKIGAAIPIQAPYPTTLARPNVTVPSFYKEILVYGYVNASGHMENLKLVRPIKPETDQALLASLSRWAFRPAKRDGVDIGVEFVLSIPVAGL